MALHVLAYDLTRVMNIIGIAPLIEAVRALWDPKCSRQEAQGRQERPGMVGGRKLSKSSKKMPSHSQTSVDRCPCARANAFLQTKTESDHSKADGFSW